MATIRVNVGRQELVFRMTATLENVQKIIRGSCGLELGRLEDLDGVTLTTGDDFIAGATYNFVGGMAPGK